MLFDYIAESYLTQIVLILVIGGGICFFRTQRHIEKEAEAERMEKRALIALQTRQSKPGQSLTEVQ